MNKIQIVTNSDRCHVSLNGTPQATFMYSNYSDDNHVDYPSLQALHDAKAECFNVLRQANEHGINAEIVTDILAN